MGTMMSFDLQQHINFAHKEKKYQCKYCNKFYEIVETFQLIPRQSMKVRNTLALNVNTRKGNLKIHIESQHKGKKYQCDFCNSEYKDKSDLRKHVKGKHEGKTYDCNTCHNKFKQKISLDIHFKNIHLQEKHPCDMCDYKATVKSVLTKHREGHYLSPCIMYDD